MAPNSPLSPKILFEDTHLLVLSKPSGLLSQGEKTGDPNLVDYLRAYLGRPYVGLVHRLDRNTSGLMVVAKRTKSAQRLTESLQKGDLVRTYLAWLIGTLSAPVQWKHQLEKNTDTNTVRVVSRGGKSAALTASPVASGHYGNTPLTLVRFQLETGRSHQIRVQAAYEKLPLLGDPKYGPRQPLFERLALHSNQLQFPHPMSKEVLQFEDPLPPELHAFLNDTSKPF